MLQSGCLLLSLLCQEVFALKAPRTALRINFTVRLGHCRNQLFTRSHEVHSTSHLSDVKGTHRTRRTIHCVQHSGISPFILIGGYLHLPFWQNQSLQLQQQQKQVRFMSKYLSRSAKKRLPLTTKRAGKGFYKGKGSITVGHITSKGKFIVDPSKLPELVIPRIDLDSFPVSSVTPLVSFWRR
jgi:hypothetical protein